MLDGTFSIRDKKMLLFIVMVVDEANCGVPLTFFLCIAQSENKHAADRYATDILEHMLMYWREWLSSQDDEAFEVLVPIMDTELMEHGTLLRVFPRIWLLICQFHLRQPWKNNCSKPLKGATSDYTLFMAQLKRLEDALVKTEQYESAKNLLANERNLLRLYLDLQTTDPEVSNTAAINGALGHLRDLENYWMREALWRCWSGFGQVVAAASLVNREVNEILPTTNHL